MNEFDKELFIALQSFEATLVTIRDNPRNELRDDLALDTIEKIKQAIEKHVIGEDQQAASPASPLDKQLFPDTRRIDYRNELRTEQRKALK